MKKLVLAVCLSLTFSAFSQTIDLESLMRQRNEYYFSFSTNDFRKATDLSSVISIDDVTDSVVYAYANDSEFAAFRKRNIGYSLLTPPSMLAEPLMTSDSRQMTDGWDYYPTYEAYEQLMSDFASGHPDKCRIDTLGTLDSGRRLLAARLCDGNPLGRPKFFYSSTVHGDEVTGWINLLRLIEYLLTDTSAQTQYLMSNIDITICPLANPDGTYYSGNNTVSGARRNNAYGIDLNRNFNDPDDGPHPSHSYYADETQIFMQHGYDNMFTMSANFHGGSEVVNYPWDTWYKTHPDDDWWQMVSRQYADTAQQYSSQGYMDYLQNGITNGYAWYTITGSRQDFMNYFTGCREVTIEISNSKMPSASNLPYYWQANRQAMLDYMLECTYGFHGCITDSLTGFPIESAQVKVLDHDADGSWVFSDSAGFYHRPIKGGNHTLQISAEGYQTRELSVAVADKETAMLNIQLSPIDDVVKEEIVGTAVFPNPSKGIFNVEVTDGGAYEVAVYGADGTELMKLQARHDFVIDLSDYPAGLYFVELKNGNRVNIQRLIRQ